MKIVQFLRDKMCTGGDNRSASDAQDLFLYRQLRSAEKKLHEARENLHSMMGLQQNAEAEHIRLTHSCEEREQQPPSAGDNGRLVDGMHKSQKSFSLRKEFDHNPDELQKNIAFLKNDINRMEVEYQQAQLNVRTHFYLKICPGSLTEADVTAGQSTQ